MSLRFFCNSANLDGLFKEIKFLTIQQKKIILIASLAFCCLAICFYAIYFCRFKPIKITKKENVADREEIEKTLSYLSNFELIWKECQTVGKDNSNEEGMKKLHQSASNLRDQILDPSTLQDSSQYQESYKAIYHSKTLLVNLDKLLPRLSTQQRMKFPTGTENYEKIQVEIFEYAGKIQEEIEKIKNIYLIERK